jgi:hypothetical protein
MHFLLFYDFVQDMATRRIPVREAHLKVARAANARGELLIAGAYGDPPNGAVLVFSGERAVVEAFVAADPYLANGLVTSWRIRPWQVGADDGAVLDVPFLAEDTGRVVDLLVESDDRLRADEAPALDNDAADDDGRRIDEALGVDRRPLGEAAAPVDAGHDLDRLALGTQPTRSFREGLDPWDLDRMGTQVADSAHRGRTS